MKKLFIIAIALLVIGLSTNAMGDAQVRDTEKWICVNTSASNMNTVIPNSAAYTGRAYIEPGKHRIVSIEVAATNTAALSYAVAAIYDAATLGAATNKTLEGEVEQVSSGVSKKMTFDRPLKIKNGVIITQGGWTMVKIEYERLIP